MSGLLTGPAIPAGCPPRPGEPALAAWPLLGEL
jgi:hypothetical protein